MKLYLTTLALSLLLLYLADTTITWRPFSISFGRGWPVPGSGSGSFDTKSESLKIIASNDGLEIRDFVDWFTIHPKAKEQAFTGQIICWGNSINYQ